MSDRIKPIPSEIGRANENDIRVLWNDGHESVYRPRYLRLKCPCAGCVDEWTGYKVLNSEAVLKDIVPLSIGLVGRYGVRVQWSDGHSDGIYTFNFLRELCPCQACGG